MTAGEVPLARNREEDSKFPYLLRRNSQELWNDSRDGHAASS
jgi:hypothetical protein